MADQPPRSPPKRKTKAQLPGGFASPATAVGALEPGEAASLIAAACDVVLVLDADGTILDLAIADEELQDELDNDHTWVGLKLVDTVTLDSRPKVAHLLADAARSETKWRHLNHRAADGHSVPVTYCCMALGEQGRTMAFGRDLRAISALQQRLVNAQHSLEQDYGRLRDAETRYRLLFQASSEAVLILDPARGRVVEANPAAREMLGAETRDIVGHPLLHRFADDKRGALETHFADARGGREPEPLRANLVHGGREVMVRSTPFSQDGATMLLVRVSSAHAVAAAATLSVAKEKLLRAVQSAPDGFVVVDNEGCIVAVNAAFVDMAQLVSEDAARGEPLDRWVGESGVDVSVLLANLRQRGAVRMFSTTLRGERMTAMEVEISAVMIGNGAPAFGLAIRNVGPRVRSQPRGAGALPRPVEQFAELVGRVALKDLVREATEVIERLAIEAALELTQDNRASAAEMLGLSRQSLYVKLRRYGLGDLEPAEDA